MKKNIHNNQTGSDFSDIDNMRRGEDYRKKIKTVRSTIVGVLLFSFLVFAVMAFFAVAAEGLTKFVSTVEGVNYFYYFLAFVVLFIGYLMRFPKWLIYMDRLGVRLNLKKNFVIYMSMYSMDITPGRWGRAIVSYTINKLTGVKFVKTFPAVVADIFTDFGGFAIIMIVCAFFVRQYVLQTVVLVVLLTLPFVFLYHESSFWYLRRLLGRFRRLRGAFEVGALYFKNHKKLGRGEYAFSMLYTLPSMVLNGVALYIVMLAFGVTLTLALLPLVIFVYSFSLLLGMVTGIPGTLAVTDAALVGFLVLFFPSFGVTLALAFAITIFFRIVSVWFVQTFGFAALIYTFRYWE